MNEVISENSNSLGCVFFGLGFGFGFLSTVLRYPICLRFSDDTACLKDNYLNQRSKTFVL